MLVLESGGRGMGGRRLRSEVSLEELEARS